MATFNNPRLGTIPGDITVVLGVIGVGNGHQRANEAMLTLYHLHITNQTEVKAYHQPKPGTFFVLQCSLVSNRG